MLLRFKICLLVLCSICFTVQAQTKYRLFIIGNSFSQNAASFLPQLTKEGGIDLELGRAELGGCSLERHWKLVETAEKDTSDPAGKAYGGKSLRQLLSQGTWDMVTIQQYSLLSGDPETYRPYAQKLYDFIKTIQPNAKIFIHQTWAYRNDAKEFGKIMGAERAKDAKEMHQHVRAAYHTIAKELNLTIIPVGDAFSAITTSPTWGYKKDTTFNYETPVSPALPDQTNSLHMGYRWLDGKLSFDANHANRAGCYLGSLVWYQTLFGGNVKKVKFKPEEVSDAMAKQFKKVVRALQ
ncbi:DUF4886 domain-containing protein [Chitinophaga sp. SYP-B3965]|uniref:DUF4886 domain-containing protein n=1 Tax=Chitinophaga sp. SYP-B3965 TaxID=2663120 RepID=UPI0012999656|nr:DUF4886 domain-containing protein [Chitinophaga sp. SYP-B3965]MRG43555.1 DUF4886 domain-containing protein [Chitinophaga sp. SYP-B3965]